MKDYGSRLLEIYSMLEALEAELKADIERYKEKMKDEFDLTFECGMGICVFKINGEQIEDDYNEDILNFTRVQADLQRDFKYYVDFSVT